jgi:hypothetical protein
MMSIYVFYMVILFVIVSCIFCCIMLFRFPFVVIIVHILPYCFQLFFLCMLSYYLFSYSLVWCYLFPLCSLSFCSRLP